MDRRRFTRGLLAALGGLAAPAGAGAGVVAQAGASAPRGGPNHPPEAVPAPGQTRSDLRVDGARLNGWLAELARFGRTPEGGISRVAFSDADVEARAYVRDLMGDAGLETRVDTAGNLVGRRGGREPALAPLMTGSHIDSVPDGGNYDGQVGAMGALEVARTLHDHGVTLRHPLEVVVFSNEEGGKTGSRALSGEVEPPEMDLPTASGRTIGEGIRFVGGDPARLAEVRRRPGDVAAFVELHVEQGGVLHGDGVDIGVVEGIVGIRRWTVTVEGFANHAGTTPMDQRRDALVATARFVDAVHRTARGMPGRQVATVGRIQAFPGAPNVIPGRAEASLEIRDLDMDRIDELFERVQGEAASIGEATGTAFAFEPFYLSRAAPTDPRIRDVVEAEARGLGLSALRMPSGAGHDAQSIALFAPVGMIFVPSRDGISHSPREFTRPGDVTAGADVMLRTLLALDGADWA